MEVKAHSLDRETIDIIKRTAAEHKSNDSAALRFIVSDWDNAHRVQVARIARIRKQIASDPNVDMLVFDDDESGGLALRRVK